MGEGFPAVPWSPLARGFLAGGRTSLHDRASTTRAQSDTYTDTLYTEPGDWDVVEAVRRVAEERGNSMAEVALAWLLSKPVIAAPIIGATKMTHLDTAVRAVNVTLSNDEIARLEAPYQPHTVRGHH